MVKARIKIQDEARHQKVIVRIAASCLNMPRRGCALFIPTWQTGLRTLPGALFSSSIGMVIVHAQLAAVCPQRAQHERHPQQRGNPGIGGWN